MNRSNSMSPTRTTKLEEEELKRALNFEKKMEFVINYDYDAITRKRAIMKTIDAARVYDPVSSQAISVNSLRISELKPNTFRELLKQLFQLKLDSAEMGALLIEFNNPNKDLIDGQIFLRYFVKLGQTVRRNEAEARKQQQLKLRAEIMEIKTKHAREREEKLELKVAYDFSEADEARAYQKLSNVAKAYDKNHSSSVSLDAFNCSSLPPPIFREALKRTLNLNLTPKELGSLVAKFDRDGDGMINCQAFLINFIQLGVDLRHQERMKQIESKKKTEHEIITEKIKKINDSEAALDTLFKEPLTEETIASAERKIRTAAMKYNKHHTSSSMGLSAFEVLSLKPVAFREAVRKTFNLNLTKAEVVAIYQRYGKENTGEIISADFLNRFMKLGIEERERVKQEALQTQRKAELELSEKQRKLVEQSIKIDMEVDYDFTTTDANQAMEKIKSVAVKYDKSLPSAVSLQSFEVAYLEPIPFYDALKRTFQIRLKPKELGAVVRQFDKQNLGVVDCTDFVHNFLRIGIEERARLYADQLKQRQKAEAERKLEAQKKIAENESKVVLQIDSNFSEEDISSAMEKIRQAALKYDKTAPGAVALTGFTAATITGTQLKDLLRRSFHINLSPKEMGVLVHKYQNFPSLRQATEGAANGEVNSEYFLSYFIRLGIEERYKLHKYHLKKKRQAERLAKEEAERKLAVHMEVLNSSIELENFTEEHRLSGLEKLTEAAERYDKTLASAPCLDGFSGMLPPAVFKDLLRRTFGISLTPEEGGALAAFYREKNTSDYISGERFLISFTQLGVDARNRSNLQRRERERALEAFEEEKRLRRLRIEMQRNMLEVDYDCTPEQQEATWKKFKAAALRFSKTSNTDSETVKGFESAYVTITEFKELLKINFNLKLNSVELGVLVSHYDKNREGKIMCEQFLHSFLQLGSEEREKLRINHMQAQRQTNEFKKQEHIRRMKAINDKLERSVEFNCTPDDERTAFEKLAEVAKKYDKNHPNAPSLETFSVAFMTPGAFGDALRKTFNLKLSGPELGAMVKFFDRQEEGVVTCQEFLTHFHKIGNSYRDSLMNTMLMKKREQKVQQSREKAERSAAQWAKKELEVDWDFDDADLEEALQKLSKAAGEYDPAHASAVSLAAFDVATMTPAVFRESLRTILHIRLSNRQLGALVNYFHKDEEKVVDCPYFLVKFTALSQSERDKLRQMQRQLRNEITERKQQAVELRKKLFEDQIEVALEEDFTKEDFNSGINKIKLAASRYDRYHPAAVGLDGFMCASLTAGQFKEQLKRVFNVILSPKELSAVVKFFGVDTDGDGSVSCSEFLQHFTRLQRTERARSSQSRLQVNKLMIEKAKEELSEKIKRKEKDEQVKLRFDDFDESSLLKKLLKVGDMFINDSTAYFTDLQTMKSQTLTAASFRDAFYRMFLIRLTFPEVGCLMNLLDENSDVMLDGATFVSALYRLGRLIERCNQGELSREALTLSSISLGGSVANLSRSATTTAMTRRYPAASSGSGALNERSYQSASGPRLPSNKQSLSQQWILPQSESIPTNSDDISSDESLGTQAQGGLSEDFMPLKLPLAVAASKGKTRLNKTLPATTSSHKASSPLSYPLTNHNITYDVGARRTLNRHPSAPADLSHEKQEDETREEPNEEQDDGEEGTKFLRDLFGLNPPSPSSSSSSNIINNNTHNGNMNKSNLSADNLSTVMIAKNSNPQNSLSLKDNHDTSNMIRTSSSTLYAELHSSMKRKTSPKNKSRPTKNLKQVDKPAFFFPALLSSAPLLSLSTTTY